MGIRETLNQNPGITTGVTAAIIVIALGFIVYYSWDSGPRIPTKAYYTVDDGANWFADDINKIPPFDKDGKPAYRAHVFRCAKGKPFVAYLERYTPDAKKKLEAARDAGEDADPGIYDEISQTGIEVKKPGTGDKWIKQSTEEAQNIMAITCPEGGTEGIEPVYP